MECLHPASRPVPIPVQKEFLLNPKASLYESKKHKKPARKQVFLLMRKLLLTRFQFQILSIDTTR